MCVSWSSFTDIPSLGDQMRQQSDIVVDRVKSLIHCFSAVLSD